MRTFTDAKAMATTLREKMHGRADISHSEALELVAAQFGLADWNVLAAKINEAGNGVRFEQGIPILRIFDIAKADEFYQGFLGFTVDWDHRFEEGMPLYRQISRAGTVIHLSEHYGDGNPGSAVWIAMHGIEEFHRDLISAKYRFARPGIDRDGPGGPTISISDPFGNMLRFCERNSG